MKKAILTTILTSMIFTNIMSQCKEGETISTNPDSPVNTELSSGHRNINTWNWGEYEIDGTDKWFSTININTNAQWSHNNVPLGYPSWNMWSPFHEMSGSKYRYLWRSSGADPDTLDWHWQDGWELMWLNLGKFPNGEEINSWSIPPAHESSPYFCFIQPLHR